MSMSLPPSREHHWDAVRAGLMLLGIPYHAALAFRPGLGWIVPVMESDPAMTVLAHVIHIFRMPAFFVIAGYFSALLLARREPGEWMRGRLRRIGVPLLASMVTIVPVLNVLCALAYPEGLSGLHALYPVTGAVLRHLWFLLVLLYLQALTALAVGLWPGLRTVSLAGRWDGVAAKWFTPFLVFSAVLMAAYCAVVIGAARWAMSQTSVMEGLFRLVDLLEAIPYFLAGMILHRAPALRAAFDRPRLGVAILTLVATLASIHAEYHGLPMWKRAVTGFAALCWAQTLIAAGRVLFHRESAAIRTIVDASLTVYLFHLPITIAFTILSYSLHWGIWAEWALICAATYLIAFAIWGGVRRVPLLNFLYAGVTPPPAVVPKPKAIDAIASRDST